MTTVPEPALAAAGDDAVRLCHDLLRIDTTNPGDGTGPGERVAAEYVGAALDAAGIASVLVEAAPHRSTVLARIGGHDASLPPLLVHGHLDTVPFDAADWARHPLSGDLADGCLWGRGAVDMKGTVAMVLALARHWARTGVRPRRDVVLAFLADEESTGDFGSRFVVARHREWFEGCREAISESGGFSITARPERGPQAGRELRVYPVAVGERGTAWMRLTARGTAGHGSKQNPDNAVATLVHALSRLASHRWPTAPTPPVEALLSALERELGLHIDRSRLAEEAVRFGQLGELFDCTVRDSANPTVLAAGGKVNVIPGRAHAEVDGRFLPGHREEFLATVDRLLGPGVTREFINCEDAVAADHQGPAFAAMADALRAEDPLARPVPFVMSGGTDAKSFARLGIRSYGFAPLLLDPSLHYYGMFHGVDERVPAAGLQFGVRVLDRFLRTY
ncbi:M20/M25/M40 family metallo-hydrolase [Streptomyces sp. TLI_171]|uniref:M20/M25/M40 family metallo-hydrolase n=1 Tax=Streptomyces sp. TLI_171 TaxID=1938859 RepID=UPI000C17984C|nr:M20/M25/M40 family metallo-hydrolase [Streptomyces sp. TLI_171]RKE23701.1 acetylornithine deacetylase/succinyl-diaminopimelate desuccinylase-like protein [Streptomyces sp. TLI_171]